MRCRCCVLGRHLLYIYILTACLFLSTSKFVLSFIYDFDIPVILKYNALYDHMSVMYVTLPFALRIFS